MTFNKEFTTLSDLKRHKVTTSSEISFECHQCYKPFTSTFNLQKHKIIHTCKIPFSCSQCDYKCSVLSSLRSHERVHTGDKPFSCSQLDLSMLDNIARIIVFTGLSFIADNSYTIRQFCKV